MQTVRSANGLKKDIDAITHLSMSLPKARIVGVDAIPTHPVVSDQHIYVGVKIIQHAEGGVTLGDGVCGSDRQDFKVVVVKAPRRDRFPPGSHSFAMVFLSDSVSQGVSEIWDKG